MTEVLHISNLLDASYIIDLHSKNKKGILEELLDVICKSDLISKPAIFRKEIFKREKLMSTGIGYGIAIPHTRHKSISNFVMAVGRIRTGVEYESIDDKPVKLIFMIGASDTQDKDYIRLLSRLMLRLKNPAFMDKIMQANDATEMYKIIHENK